MQHDHFQKKIVLAPAPIPEAKGVLKGKCCAGMLLYSSLPLYLLQTNTRQTNTRKSQGFNLIV